MSTSSKTEILRTSTRFFDILPSELCLAAVLPTGQSFRWIKSVPALHTLSDEKDLEMDEEWCFPSRDRLIYLRQDRTRIWYNAAYTAERRELYEEDCQKNTTFTWLHRYFSLDVSLAELYKIWSERDLNFLNKTQGGRFAGIRVLKQDPWETLISFICSSNNNIGRITLMITRLCASLGEPLAPHQTAHSSLPMYSFPAPDELTSDTTDELLRDIGFGYRAPYVHSTSLLLTSLSPDPDEYLKSLSALGYTEAREQLQRFKGVGPKVADCIALFGLGFEDAVPVDTHVYSIAVKDYGFKNKGAVSKEVYARVGEKLKEVWGVKAGWCQQILFTADLKAFAMFEDPLASPVSTPKKEKVSFDLQDQSSPLASSSTKRKVKEEKEELWSSPSAELSIKTEQGLTLAERVKGRSRRASGSPSPKKKVKKEEE